MVIDSSAIVAILQQEPEAERLALAIARDNVRLVSAASWVECGVVAFLRAGEEGIRDLDLLAAKCRLQVATVTAKQAGVALQAFMSYGKGVHPARLNFGDCFAYALAKDAGEPLLFKGEDFGRTDITAAPY
jgi:ribonuclease VapC